MRHRDSVNLDRVAWLGAINKRNHIERFSFLRLAQHDQYDWDPRPTKVGSRVAG